MKIRTKILLLSSIFLVIMVASIAAIVAYTVYDNAEKEIQSYRANEISRIKIKLKGHTDIVYDLIDAEYQAAKDSKVIEKHYGQGAKNVIEVANTILNVYQQQVESGQISLIQAQTLAKTELSVLRYNDGVGYVWINDTELPVPNMIMHPTVPSLNDKPLDNKKWNTAKGDIKNLFEAAVKLTKKENSGFIEYEWPKPMADGKLTEMQPKISYVSLFKPWDWVIGTGLYVDDAKTDGIEKIIETVNKVRYDEGEGYFFIITNDFPYPTTVTDPLNPNLAGKLMNDSKWDNLAFNQSEHMFTALVKSSKNTGKAGYVDYIWKSPSGNEMLPKLSYTRVYEPLNWIVGTGVYTDNIDKDVAAKEKATRAKVEKLIKHIISISGIILIFSLLASFFFAKGLSKGLEELTKVAREISLGKGLDDKIESVARKDEIGQLARAIERLQTSVKMMMKRMEKKN